MPQEESQNRTIETRGEDEIQTKPIQVPLGGISSILKDAKLRDRYQRFYLAKVRSRDMFQGLSLED